MSTVFHHYPLGFSQIYLDLLELWADRVAGGLGEDGYTKKLAQTGFNQTWIETARVYGLEDARAFLFG